MTRNLGVHIQASRKDTDSAQLSGPTGTGGITGGPAEGRKPGKNEVNREKSRTGKGREAERKGQLGMPRAKKPKNLKMT